MRIAFGVVAGFVAWMAFWFAAESSFAGLLPEWYGAHQRAFTAAIKNGGPFSPDGSILSIHIACGAVVSGLAGYVAAWVAREDRRAPLILGFVLLGLAALKATMSWALVPLWYHVAFAAPLLPMALVGGRAWRRLAPNA